MVYDLGWTDASVFFITRWSKGGDGRDVMFTSLFSSSLDFLLVHLNIYSTSLL
jgi:hypothetical protein